MGKKIQFRGLIAGIAILTVAVVYLFLPGSENKTSIDDSRYTLEGFVELSDTLDFARATAPQQMDFPQVFQPYPEFRTGWWYYTGNLETESGRHFGYQLTFFRSALLPDTASGESGWRSNQIYMAHFAVADIESNNFHAFERFSRGAVDLAGAKIYPFKVWLEDWQAVQINDSLRYGIPVTRLLAAEGEVSLDLKLAPLKPPVLQGDDGYSRKGPEEGNASYYFSLTRLKSEGMMVMESDTFAVSGFSWMDREWSTSALGSEQAGWDWFSLQLSDTTEIMYYQIRNNDGTPSSFSKGVFVQKNGDKVLLSNNEVTLTVIETWESPLGGEYPHKWQMEFPRQNISLTIEPLMSDQELDVYVRYWEGAVKVNGSRNGEPVTGNGYVELTGYAEQGIPGLQ